jgi:hypothetical protein
MKSAIFSILSGIALTLLMRGPAPPPPPPPPPPQRCVIVPGEAQVLILTFEGSETPWVSSPTVRPYTLHRVVTLLPPPTGDGLEPDVGRRARARMPWSESDPQTLQRVLHGTHHPETE